MIAPCSVASQDAYLYEALQKIEALLTIEPSTYREKQIYEIACRALNIADGEAILIERK